MRKFILISIFITVIPSYLYMGCEKADMQKSATNDSVQITTRGECDDCPGANECCCIIEFLDGDPGDFMICGTSDGDAVACEVNDSPCANEIDGLQHTYFQLDDMINTFHLFCVNENMAFQIGRFASPTGTTSTRISCQRGQTGQQWVPQSFTNGERVDFDLNGSCELEGPCEE